MRLFLIAGTVLLLFACKKEALETDLSLLQKQRKIWENQRIDSYKIDQQMSCFCPNALVAIFTCTIENGILVTVDYQAYDAERHAHLKTIDAVFDYLEQRLGDNPDHFSVNYDATYGFPVDFYIDQSEMIADEEIGYTFSNFRSLE
ncbi:MAG: DUF6174 domain-containing protein [Flavobacteriaceae bacterium]